MTRRLRGASVAVLLAGSVACAGPGAGDGNVSDERLQEMVDARIAATLEQIRDERRSLQNAVELDSQRIDQLSQTLAEFKIELTSMQRFFEGFRKDDLARSQKVSEAITGLDTLRGRVDTRLAELGARVDEIAKVQKGSQADLERTNAEIRDLNQEMTSAVGYLERIRRAFEEVQRIQREAAEKTEKILEDLRRDG